MNKKLILLLILLAAAGLACKALERAITPDYAPIVASPQPPNVPTKAPLPTNLPPSQTENNQGQFNTIVFCEDVTDDGEPVNPTSSFPGGTTVVWAFFTYSGMQDGQAWGRLWEESGDTYYDALEESWEDGESGWVAYSIGDPTGIPLNGDYRLTLYIDGQEVQAADFEVAPPEKEESSGMPAFGAIQFAGSITQDRVPVGTASQFDPGIQTVYAVFPYENIPADQKWGKEWLLNGETINESEGVWGTPEEGITYLYLTTENEKGLAPGKYIFNLYLDGQVARSANFEVLGANRQPVQPPAQPEEVIDPELMEAWDLLNNAHDEYHFLHDLAQFVLDQHILVDIDEEHYDNTAGYYRIELTACQPTFKVGDIWIIRDYWNANSWEAVASVLAHELTHAQQHSSGDYRCPGCSINAEYWARIAEFYTLLMLNRKDLIYDWPVFNDDGSFSSDKVWQVTKEIYGEDCPDY